MAKKKPKTRIITTDSWTWRMFQMDLLKKASADGSRGTPEAIQAGKVWKWVEDHVRPREHELRIPIELTESVARMLENTFDLDCFKPVKRKPVVNEAAKKRAAEIRAEESSIADT